jgi:hypothetical protein
MKDKRKIKSNSYYSIITGNITSWRRAQARQIYQCVYSRYYPRRFEPVNGLVSLFDDAVFSISKDYTRLNGTDVESMVK